ncbi:protein GOLM2 [Narcine bancroftii]|uniref:protein GOLM2 n=1 Tax=Narcine bancroftii TaxID=1343680 RepID=UPI0038311D40
MAAKNPALLVIGLAILLSAGGLYLWRVASENTQLRLQNSEAVNAVDKLRKATDELTKNLAETRLNLDDKKHYISDIDAKLLKASGDLEASATELRNCLDNEKIIKENTEKQKTELEEKEAQLKTLTEEKKKIETSLGEFKKICNLPDLNETIKKVCSGQS